MGESVTLTATPDNGYYFAGWSGDLAGATNPAVITMDSNKIITATFSEQLPGLLNEDFEMYAPSANPNDWLDTTANNSMVEDDLLFTVADVAGDLAFSTNSTQKQHSFTLSRRRFRLSHQLHLYR